MRRDPKRFRSIARTCLIVGVVGMIGGCGGPSEIQRDFTRTVTVQGRDLLKIDCQYLGKSPGEPDKYQSSHDYRTIDTDFYQMAFTNLTDQEIHIAGIAYRMAEGPLRSLSHATKDSIKQNWGTTIIPAQGTISHPNGFVWAKGRQNRMIKTYSFRTQDAEGKPLTFQEEVSLWYAR